MAGLGSRFSKDPDYKDAPPKPLIQLPNDKTLIETAIGDLIPSRYTPRYIFVVRPQMRVDYDLANVLSTILLKNDVNPSSLVIIDATELEEGGE